MANSSKLTKILIIRFSSFGDIVMTFPILHYLQRHLNCEIHFFTKSKFAEIVKVNKTVSTVIELPNKSSLSDLRKIAKDYAFENYDYIFDLHSNLRTLYLKLFLKKKIYSISKPRVKELLLFTLRDRLFNVLFSKINRINIYAKPVMAELSDSGESLKYSAADLRFENYVLPFEMKDQMNLTSTSALTLPKSSDLSSTSSSPPFAVLVPGGAWSEKSWAKENYKKLISELKNKINIVILGGNKEVFIDEIVEHSSKVNSHNNNFSRGNYFIVNLRGKTNFENIFSIVSKSSFVIGNDTGILHVAESLNKPTYMIMGPTSSNLGFFPNSSNGKVIESSLWCRPCSKNGKLCFRIGKNKRKCLKDISVTDVIAQIEELK